MQKALSVQIRLPHGHIWTFPIVDAFVDSRLKGGPQIARVGPMREVKATVEATFTSSAPAVKAELYYTVDVGRWQDRHWLTKPATIEGTRITAELPTPEASAYTLAVTDSAGNIVTCRPFIAAK